MEIAAETAASTVIVAAKASNMRVAAIPTAACRSTRLQKEADYLLNNLSEVPAIVRDARTAH